MSEEEERAERVVFRVDGEGEVFALFPDLPATDWGHCTCYEHVGQHSAASYARCITASRPAKPEEFGRLKRELETIGYRLRVVQKATRRRRP